MGSGSRGGRKSLGVDEDAVLVEAERIGPHRTLVGALGDAGFEHGGTIPGHASHDVGLDIDMWPIRTDNAQCTAGRITWQSSTYDRAATRQLIQMIRAAAPGHVKVIWFNDLTLIAPLVKAPVLVLWGDQDGLFDLSHQEKLEKAYPEADFEIFKGAGHNMFWEFPEKAAKIINLYLDDKSE